MQWLRVPGIKKIKEQKKKSTTESWSILIQSNRDDANINYEIITQTCESKDNYEALKTKIPC